MSIKKDILKKLFRHRYIGARHTEIKNATKGFPPHLSKDVKKQVKQMIKQNLILAKTSTKEIHISLNPKKIKEIKKIIFN